MTRVAELLGRGRTYSFEFFPPRDDLTQLTLGRTIAELEPLQPSFVSVTYGAGGSTRERTRNVVAWVAQETAITPMAHLTCQGHLRSEIASILEDYRIAGVENIMALGGDAPAAPDARPSEYRYASDLIADVAATGAFSIGVAAHPEVHPSSPDRATDRRHLAAKLTMADFAITQFFFEAHHYVRLVDELADLGVSKPVIPGIMPITNVKQIARMARMSGAALPARVVEAVESVDDPADVRRIGVDIAAALCADLLAAGAPGLHFYTMNRSSATREIYASLGLGPEASQAVDPELVGRESAGQARRSGRGGLAPAVQAP
jgi:methylenetetrahydrofolate reductase (NADPH)